MSKKYREKDQSNIFNYPEGQSHFPRKIKQEYIKLIDRILHCLCSDYSFGDAIYDFTVETDSTESIVSVGVIKSRFYNYADQSFYFEYYRS